MNAVRDLARHPLTIRLAQVAIGLVFGYAALAKIGDPQAFARQVHNFRMVPVALENLVALILPWVELLASLALLLAVRARAGALLTLALMVVFTAAVALAAARGLDIACGCFGTADAQRVGLTKVLQNLLLLGIAGLATLRRRS